MFQRCWCTYARPWDTRFCFVRSKLKIYRGAISLKYSVQNFKNSQHSKKIYCMVSLIEVVQYSILSCWTVLLWIDWWVCVWPEWLSWVYLLIDQMMANKVYWTLISFIMITNKSTKWRHLYLTSGRDFVIEIDRYILIFQDIYSFIHYWSFCLSSSILVDVTCKYQEIGSLLDRLRN